MSSPTMRSPVLFGFTVHRTEYGRLQRLGVKKELAVHPHTVLRDA
jgi:hypothetical protein